MRIKRNVWEGAFNATPFSVTVRVWMQSSICLRDDAQAPSAGWNLRRARLLRWSTDCGTGDCRKPKATTTIIIIILSHRRWRSNENHLPRLCMLFDSLDLDIESRQWTPAGHALAAQLIKGGSVVSWWKYFLIFVTIQKRPILLWATFDN